MVQKNKNTKIPLSGFVMRTKTIKGQTKAFKAIKHRITLARGLPKIVKARQAMARREFEELKIMISEKRPIEEIMAKLKRLESLSAKANNIMRQRARQIAIALSRDAEFPQLLNKDFFCSKLDSMLLKSGEHTLVYIDIDRLRSINDLLGGRTIGGMGYLTTFAHALSKSMPKDGFVRHDGKKLILRKGFAGHIGGDEFLIYLPMNPKKAQEFLSGKLERIRQAELKRWKMHPKAKQMGFSLTYSAGLVGINKRVSVDRAILEADIQCEQAKKKGREQVTFSTRIL
jgi:diguanylate cyclase (GGDEF)-like protein